MTHTKEWLRSWKPPVIKAGQPTVYGWTVSRPKKFTLGRYTDIGCYTYIQSEEGVTIEDYVEVGGGCMIYSVNTIEGTRGPVVLKKGCRMGANCVVLPGVTIGEGAVIGACSLVKSDVPSYEVWGGVPAKRLDTLHP